MPSIVFVCTANRYRSPIAAACFRRELTARNDEESWTVASAGTWTRDGLPAMPEAIAAARRLGLNISQHVSAAITGKTMQACDLIIVMEQGQREALRSEFPESGRKVHLLTEAAGGVPYDIPDPVGSRTGDDVPAEIEELIHSGFDRICSLAKGP